MSPLTLVERWIDTQNTANAEALDLLMRHGYVTRKSGSLRATEELMFSLVQPERLARPRHPNQATPT